jgi:hypothetical protein
MSRRAEIDKNSSVSVEMRMLLEQGVKVLSLSLCLSLSLLASLFLCLPVSASLPLVSPSLIVCLLAQVTHHRPDKKIVQSILSFSEAENRLTIQPASSSFFDFNSLAVVLSLVCSPCSFDPS